MYNQPEVALEKYELTVSRIIKGRGAYICDTGIGQKLLVPYRGHEQRACTCGIRWHLSRETVWMWSRYHRQRSSVSYREITVRTHTY